MQFHEKFKCDFINNLLTYIFIHDAKFKVSTHFEVFTQFNTKSNSRFSQETFDCFQTQETFQKDCLDLATYGDKVWLYVVQKTRKVFLHIVAK